MTDPRDDQYEAAAHETLVIARKMTAATGARLITFEPDDALPPPQIQEWAKGYAADFSAGKVHRCACGDSWSTPLFLFGDIPNVAMCARCSVKAGEEIAASLLKADVAMCDVCSGFGDGRLVPVVMPLGAVLARLRVCEWCLVPAVPVS